MNNITYKPAVFLFLFDDIASPAARNNTRVQTRAQNIIDLIGDEPLLEIAHRMKLQWFSHTTGRPSLMKGARERGTQKEHGSHTLQSGQGLGLQHV